MSDEQRVDKINAASLKYLGSLLQALEDESLDEDHLLAKMYASLTIAKLLGFNPTAMAEDAEAAAQRLIDLVDDKQVINNESI